jgi:hypothetical protein
VVIRFCELDDAVRFGKQVGDERDTIGGGYTFVNVADWKSTAAFRTVASKPEFPVSLPRCAGSAVASPHIITEVAVPAILGG